MQIKYLFPYKYRKIGWIILIPSFILGIFYLTNGYYSPDFLDVKIPQVKIQSFRTDTFKYFKNNILDEIIGVLLLVSLLFVAFSKEKNEDEFISKIRLESLVWATYFNYAILLLAIIFVYDFQFLNVMIINMFTILIIFIIRFNWEIWKFKKVNYEE